ncbi:MAG: hypothetical protein WD969_10920 [Paracoccaceae bacterium]
MLVVEEEITGKGRLCDLSPPAGFITAFLKVTDHINARGRKFISASSFVVIATKLSEWRIDVSPKGDE